MASGLPLDLISAFAGTSVTTQVLHSISALPVAQELVDSGSSSMFAAACKFRGPAVLNPSELVGLFGKDGGNSGAGYVIKDGWMGEDTLARVRSEVQAFDDAGKLRPAGMGKADTAWTSPDHRGDRIMWLSTLLSDKDGEDRATDSSELPTTSIPVGLRAVVNRVLDLNAQLKHCCPHLNLIDRISIQVACYPGSGTRYVRHLDAVRPDDPTAPMRKITVLYYLNSGWNESSDGGALRLFFPSVSGEVSLDIFPHADRMLVFLSDTVPHEVLPAFAVRYSVTVWLYGQADSGVSCVPPPRTISPVGTLPCDVDDTIFVTIPCYRDTECQHTVNSLFAHATRPARVFVGICWQLDETDESSCCNHRIFTTRKRQIRSIKLDCRDAAGPVWARHLAMSLWHGEAYVLQIDSHMRFVSGWDEILIQQLGACGQDKAVLSTYPPGYALPDNVPPLSETPVPVMCFTKFGEEGLPRFTGEFPVIVSFPQPGVMQQEALAGKAVKAATGAPIPGLFWAAGFSFSRASLFTQVPYDSSLKHLFFGEEISFWARAWSHGWRVFAPGQPVVYHLWSRSHRPTFREHSSAFTRDAETNSREAVLRQFFPDSAACCDSYVHGFLKSVGLDFVTKSGSDFAKHGGLGRDDFA